MNRGLDNKSTPRLPCRRSDVQFPCISGFRAYVSLDGPGCYSMILAEKCTRPSDAKLLSMH
eukprot:8738407-Pyramimonas_sp.AAC.1